MKIKAEKKSLHKKRDPARRYPRWKCSIPQLGRQTRRRITTYWVLRWRGLFRKALHPLATPPRIRVGPSPAWRRALVHSPTRKGDLCAVFRLILMRGIFRGFLWLVIVVCGQLVVIAVVSVLVRCLAEREAILSCWRGKAYILSRPEITMGIIVSDID